MNNSSLAIGSILSGADVGSNDSLLVRAAVLTSLNSSSTRWYTLLPPSSTTASSWRALPGSKVRRSFKTLAVVDRFSDPSLADYRIRTGRNVLESSSAGDSASAPANSSINILANTALANFNACQSALSRQAKYWLGVGWIGAIVDKQGAKASRSSIKTATEGLHTFVSGPEMVGRVEALVPVTELTTVLPYRLSSVVSLSASQVGCELPTSTLMVRLSLPPRRRHQG